VAALGGDAAWRWRLQARVGGMQGCSSTLAWGWAAAPMLRCRGGWRLARGDVQHDGGLCPTDGVASTLASIGDGSFRVAHVKEEPLLLPYSVLYGFHPPDMLD
jgi:hypothetical protein